MSFVPEIIIREVIARGIALLRTDAKIIPSLFTAEDSFVPGLSSRFKAYLEKHPKIPVVFNYPSEDLSLPNVAIVSLKSQESIKDLAIGDQFGYYGVYADTTHPAGVYDSTKGLNIVSTSEVIGVYDDANYHIIITTQDDILTTILTAALRIVIYHAKIRLETDYGFQCMKLADYDFKFPRDYWPKQTWSKTIQLQGLVRKEITGEAFSDTEDSNKWGSIVPKIKEVVASVTQTNVKLTSS